MTGHGKVKDLEEKMDIICKPCKQVVEEFIRGKERLMYENSYLFLTAFREGYLSALDVIARSLESED